MKRTGGRYVVEGGERRLVQAPTAPRSSRPGGAQHAPGRGVRKSKPPKEAANADIDQPSKPDPATIEKASNTAPSKEDN